MPAIYAHNRFGFDVLKNLDENIKQLILEYKSQFMIGLQGPDYLFFCRPFYYNKVNMLGVNMHKRPAKEFLNNIIPVIKQHGKDSPHYAYTLGFICHHVLDSSCHPYINSMVKELSFNHIELESEFERFLLIKDGIEPLSYPIHELVPTDDLTVNTLYDLYSTYNIISKKDVKSSLNQMRLIKRILLCKKPFKRNAIDTFMHLTGHYDMMQGHLLHEKVNEKSKITNSNLIELYDNSINTAVELITEFDKNIFTNAPLNIRFDRSFE